MADPHPFDAAMALQPAGEHLFTGHGSPAYWNMIGPFGGITAAVLLQAVLDHPQRLGDPVALTVNYAGAVAPGPFTIEARPARTNRSSQHWIVQQWQTDAQGQRQLASTATVLTALRRDTWAASDAPMPAAPPPEGLPRALRPGDMVAWLQRYETRVITGEIPGMAQGGWDGRVGESSLTRWWLRDDPPRPPCFASLAALADVFFPRIWLKRALRVPVGTVSMTVYFLADAATLAACGTRHLLAEARGQGFHGGHFDQTGLLWSPDGTLLASTHQVVYYKE